MKKTLAVLFLTMVMLLSLLACSTGKISSNGGKNTATAQANTPSARKIELRVAWWGGQSRNDKFNKMFDAYESEHPNIKIIREFNGETQFVEKVTIQAAGGNAPDVFQASSFYLDDFIERKMFRELDDMIASGDIDLSDFEQIDIQAGQKNGKQYLILWGHIITGIIYNADLLTEMDIALPQNEWTWDEYVQTLKNVQKNIGPEKWATEDEGGLYRVFECFAQMKGKSLFEGDKLGIGKEDMIEWFNMWVELREAGVVPSADIQNEQGGKILEQSMLAANKVAMVSTSSNQLVTFQSLTEDDLNIVSYPWIEGAVRQTPMIASGMGISANTRYPKEAAHLINWLVNSESAQAIFLAEHGQPPSRKMQEFFIPLANKAQMEENAFFTAMIPEIVPYPAQPAGSNSIKTLLLQENEAIAFKQKTIEKAVDDFFKQAEQILQR